jgi:malonyl-CoA/methylmalonyl-CoA synthetase
VNLLAETLLDAARHSPEKVAILDDEVPLTYGELDALSAQLAHVLLGRYGVSGGDRVAVQLAKRPEVIALNLACVRAGVIYVPLNPTYTEREVGALLADATPTLLVRDEPLAHATRRVSLSVLLEEASAQPRDFDDVSSDANTPAAILFTSGTTGQPKGAVLTQGNLAFGATTLCGTWAITPNDVVLHVLPLFHVHGLFVAAYCSLASGATMRFLRDFDVDAVIDVLAESTLMMGVPTHYTRLLGDERFTAPLAGHVRLFISGSAPMRATTHEEFFARTGQRILERYGTTETGMITSNPLEGERRVGSVGRALPGVEVRVSGGSPGSIEVRGPNVCAGYWGRPRESAEAFSADGFFITGDLGVLDADGYLEIVGRSKDLIITGGLNVYPKEVEGVIDALAGVLECAVVGIADPDFGEAVTAVVVLAPGARLRESQLRDMLRGQLAPFKIPKHVVFVADLPRNAMGKVEKARLRRDYPNSAPR